MAKKESTELVVLSQDQYPALNEADPRVQLMLQNLGGESLAIADFNRIKVPSGVTANSTPRWTIESAAGGEVVDTIEGVIMHTSRRRAYWSNPNPSEAPPDCSSNDMLAGVGNPGGSCIACPFNAFGSAANGHGKACKECRITFLLRKDQVLPDIVKIPPASLKNMRKYLMQLSQIGLPFFAVTTTLGLEKGTNADNTAYAKVTAKMSGKLDEASVKAVIATVRRYEGTFAAASVDAADVQGDEPKEF
jgi:hypothetical protein